jgi:TPR repeat protein
MLIAGQFVASFASWSLVDRWRCSFFLSFFLGVLYCKGKGVPLDYFQAANWFTRAARLGDPAAETDLGTLYENGRGVSLDYVAAYTWYYRAAAAGDPSASSHLKNLAKIMTPKELDRAKAVLFAESPLPQSAPDKSSDSGKGNNKHRKHQ